MSERERLTFVSKLISLNFIYFNQLKLFPMVDKLNLENKINILSWSFSSFWRIVCIQSCAIRYTPNHCRWVLVHRVRWFGITAEAAVYFFPYFYVFTQLNALFLPCKRVFDEDKISDEHQLIKTFVHSFIHSSFYVFDMLHSTKQFQLWLAGIRPRPDRVGLHGVCFLAAVWCFSN